MFVYAVYYISHGAVVALDWGLFHLGFRKIDIFSAPG